MKWDFGHSRDSDDRYRWATEIVSLRAQVNVLMGQAKALTGLVDRLTSSLVDLKREGFAPPVADFVRTDTEPELAPEIIDAIDSRASRRSALWSQLAQDAARDKRDADDVARDIYLGGDPDGFEE